MNTIKTLLTFAGQLLLVCAVPLLTQQVVQGQTDVNVVNTPTVRIDSRGNEVRIVNSVADPLKVRNTEEPFQVYLITTTGINESSKCVLIPIPQGRVAVFEHVAVSDYHSQKIEDVELAIRIKSSSDQYESSLFGMYDIPLNDKGRGLLQLKLHVKGASSDASTGEVYAPAICYKNPYSAVSQAIRVIVSGHLLPQ
jgi:hypothetical protein